MSFIEELDDFFIDNYTNVSDICSLEGYVHPMEKILQSRARGQSDEKELIKLSHQSDPKALLVQLKENLVDGYFSFSFVPRGFVDWWAETFKKQPKPCKYLIKYLNKHGENAKEFYKELEVDKEIWGKILSGKFYPTKRFIMKIALVANFTLKECENMLALCGFELSSDEACDVVLSYLLTFSVYSPMLIKQAFDEYKIDF